MGTLENNEWRAYLTKLYKNEVSKILFNKQIEIKEISIKDAYPKDKPKIKRGMAHYFLHKNFTNQF